MSRSVDRRAVGVGHAAGAVVHEDERVVTQLPLSGTMTTASTTHKPITNHGTHWPPTYVLHRLSDAYFVPSESETMVNTALRPVGRTRCPAHQRGGVEVLPGRQGPGDTAVGPDEQRVDVHPVRAGVDGVDPSGPRGRGVADLRAVTSGPVATGLDSRAGVERRSGE